MKAVKIRADQIQELTSNNKRNRTQMTTIVTQLRAVAAALVMTALPASAASLLVEAERFDDKGGWSVDQQFRDLMGRRI